MKREVVGRRITELVRMRMDEIPVILIHGPRSVGKTTVLRSLASSWSVEIIDLDEPSVRAAAHASPELLTSGSAPILIDEHQHVRQLPSLIKNRLNSDGSPGQFVLTGSTGGGRVLSELSQFLTGRLYRLPLYPFSQGELDSVRENLLVRLFEDPESLVDGQRSSTTREQYVSRVTRGGFPPTRRLTTGARARWFDNYIALCLERISDELARVGDPEALRRLLRVMASRTAQVLNITSAGETAGLRQKTAHNYVRHLEAAFLIDRLPSWGTTLRARVTRHPKVHLIDTGVAARLQGLSTDRLGLHDPTALQQFGHLLETFVVSELRKQASWMDHDPIVGHWRTKSGREVDLVVERWDGSVVAFEVKAGSNLSKDNTRGLAILRDDLGDRFRAGICFYTGQWPVRMRDRIMALPIDRLWKSFF